MVIGAVSAFGLVVSSITVAVVVAGLLQWLPSLPPAVDLVAPSLVLVGGFILAGRVAVDVAGALGVVAAAGAAATVGLFVFALVWFGESHGDALEPLAAAYVSGAVLLLVGGSAWVVRRARNKPPGVHGARP